MGKDIDFQVRLQLNRAADEFVENETKSAGRAEDRFLVAFKCDGALDPEGRIIVSWRDGVREFEKMRRSAERINLVESFTENILLVPSDELRARLIASDELRAWLLDGLLKFFCSSKVDENFLVRQAWKAEKWLSVDDDFFRFKAYQLLRNQDQPQQTAAPVVDQAKKYTKKNTAKEAANVFFDKHVGDDNSIFAALRVGKGKGKCQEEFPELWELFKKEHSEITQKEAITRDSFKTYLNNWRQKKVTTEN